jgi:hypothetical protein
MTAAAAAIVTIGVFPAVLDCRLPVFSYFSFLLLYKLYVLSGPGPGSITPRDFIQITWRSLIVVGSNFFGIVSLIYTFHMRCNMLRYYALQG